MTLYDDVTTLVYELLDAHADTVRLAAREVVDEQWQVHLDYLQALQRIAREALARRTLGDRATP